ncbi:MAG TPA: hypothetical protein VG984_02470 [Candidatus Paceibacterota bacterium]|nr:hypothetical protein [Candidatus Paceibacterota bacterium]
MFSVGMTSDGKLYAVKRFNSARSGEDVIALAFESVRRLAGSDGRVTTHTLSKHYGSNLDLVGLGFSGDATVSCELLDRVWLEALATYARPNWDTSPRMNWVDAA